MSLSENFTGVKDKSDTERALLYFCVPSSSVACSGQQRYRVSTGMSIWSPHRSCGVSRHGFEGPAEVRERLRCKFESATE